MSKEFIKQRKALEEEQEGVTEEGTEGRTTTGARRKSKNKTWKGN